MPETQYQELATRLLKAGVAPKHVRRTVVELRDHFEDIKAERIGNGMSQAEAEQEALARLGSEDAIAEDILAKPELKSWAARWPWAVYGLGPTLTLALFVFVFVQSLAGFIVVAQTFGYLAPEVAHLTPPSVKISTDILLFAAVYVVPLLIGVHVCRQSALRQSSTGWPEFGLLIFCACAAAFDMGVNWPATPEEARSIQVGFAFAPPFPITSETVIRTVVNITVVAVMLRFFRQRPVRL